MTAVALVLIALAALWLLWQILAISFACLEHYNQPSAERGETHVRSEVLDANGS